MTPTKYRSPKLEENVRAVDLYRLQHLLNAVTGAFPMADFMKRRATLLVAMPLSRACKVKSSKLELRASDIKSTLAKKNGSPQLDRH